MYEEYDLEKDFPLDSEMIRLKNKDVCNKTINLNKYNKLCYLSMTELNNINIIGYPTTLDTLNLLCTYIKLDNLPENLVDLVVYHIDEYYNKSFTSDDFINLPQNLIKFKCYNCKINNLNNLPDYLKELCCKKNKLTSLDYLPESLEILDCSYNLITELNNLPRGLKYLECSGNQIINLDSLPDSLEQIFCKLNKIEVIHKLPSSLTRANFTGNPLITKPKCSNSLILLNYSLDAEKASTTDKALLTGHKFAYNSYHTVKYSTYGLGISLVLITCPVYLAYLKFKKLIN